MFGAVATAGYWQLFRPVVLAIRIWNDNCVICVRRRRETLASSPWPSPALRACLIDQDVDEFGTDVVVRFVRIDILERLACVVALFRVRHAHIVGA
jgi:hypothetical protein